jgi:hypothetical protein
MVGILLDRPPVPQTLYQARICPVMPPAPNVRIRVNLKGKAYVLTAPRASQTFNVKHATFNAQRRNEEICNGR